MFAEFNWYEWMSNSPIFLVLILCSAVTLAVAAERAVGFPASEANYTYYLAPGSQHCILPRPELYTLKVGEVSFLDWLRALAEGRTPPRVRP